MRKFVGILCVFLLAAAFWFLFRLNEDAGQDIIAGQQEVTAGHYGQEFEEITEND